MQEVITGSMTRQTRITRDHRESCVTVLGRVQKGVIYTELEVPSSGTRAVIGWGSRLKDFSWEGRESWMKNRGQRCNPTADRIQPLWGRPKPTLNSSNREP